MNVKIKHRLEHRINAIAATREPCTLHRAYSQADGFEYNFDRNKISLLAFLSV